MPRTLQLALLQHACPIEAAKADHLATCERLIRQAANDGAQLIVTQELFAGHYFCQVEDDALFDLAEPIPGPTSQHIASLAAELNVTISASLFEQRAAGLYHNTTATFGNAGQLIGTYRKMHIPDDPRFYEKYYFTPGDLGWQTFDLPPTQPSKRGRKVGTLVCWDQWFPEAARLTALKGAELLLYPTAIGYYNDADQGEPADVREQQRIAWQTMMQSHAIANGVFVAAANRIGTENDLTFWGSSFVCAPDGSIIAQASQNQEQVLHAELDFDMIEAQRRGWPFLRDRRIDAYDPLLKRMDDA
ncbi:MAG: carbon-nitrogen hydrolase [Phycisphaeraceae bacterium]